MNNLGFYDENIRVADVCDVFPVDLQNNPAPSISYSQREEEKVLAKNVSSVVSYILYTFDPA